MKMEQMIETGQWVPGAKLPTEKQLKERLGVSASILREAFRILESKGLIISKQGKGRFLRKIRPELIKNEYLPMVVERSALLDIVEVRRGLETEALKLVIERATDETIDWLEKTTIENKNSLEKWGKYVDIYSDFDVCLAKASGNSLLESLVKTLVLSLRSLKQRFIIGYDQWLPLHMQHISIIKAIRCRDFPLAKELLNCHLDGVQQALQGNGMKGGVNAQTNFEKES